MLMSLKDEERLLTEKEKTAKRIEEAVKVAPEKWLDVAIDQRLASWGLRHPKDKPKSKAKSGPASSASKIFVESTKGSLEKATLGGGGEKRRNPAKSEGPTNIVQTQRHA